VSVLMLKKEKKGHDPEVEAKVDLKKMHDPETDWAAGSTVRLLPLAPNHLSRHRHPTRLRRYCSYGLLSRPWTAPF